MNTELAAFWDRTLTRLVDAVGREEALAIATETRRRMGRAGDVRDWTRMLLRVANERGTPPLSWLGKRS